MIVSINKPFLREWTTFKQVPRSARSLSGCRRSAIVPYRAAHFRHDVAILSSRKISAARYSTIPEQRGMKVNADVPPPSNASPTKPKIDLRPAPKKVSKDVRIAANPPSPPAPTPEASSSTQARSAMSSKETELTSLGPINATKHDIAEAAKHGILTPPPEGASRIAALWHNAKQFFWFYYRGIKIIFTTHRRRANAIRQRLRDAKTRGAEVSMSRYETRFMRTYNRDLVKFVPFILTVIVLEEVIPLIVLYAPSFLPSTCLLPSQRERIEVKRRAKRVAHMALAKAELESPNPSPLTVDNLPSELTRAVSGILARPTFGPVFLQRFRLSRYFSYLGQDDNLLLREGMGAQLTEAELLEALDERGFVIDPSISHQEKLQKLKWWLKQASDDTARLGLILENARSTST
ncbi:hypothetical protein BU17DRAFT_70006 [Hysterangium stoloniferum]|nr:hypothetical protein BU17DRAFT_70006 [Hysterangium stoloniferum]